MKNLLLFLLLVAVVGLGFYERQLSADLEKAQADNATLTNQLADMQRQIADLQAKLQQAAAEHMAQSNQPAPPPTAHGRAPTNGQDPWGLQYHGGLDQKPY